MSKIPVEEMPEGADPVVYQAMVDAGEITHESKKAPEHIEDPEPDEDKGGEGEGGDEDPNKKQDDPEDSDKGEKKPINREVHHIPAWKHKEDMKKAREEAAEETRQALQKDFEEKLKAAGGKPGGATDDDVQKIADEFGIKPEVVPAFIERIAGAVQSKIKGVELSAEDRAALDATREGARLQKEEEGFKNEWGDAATQTALKAVSGGKQITEEVRSRVKELAYSSTYNRYRLADIIALEGPKLFPKGDKTGESGRGGAGRGQESKTIDEMSPEEILNMPDDEFKRLSDELGGKGSRFIQTKKK